ncbi:MAG TPA: DMT family transporter [Usitatibacter sp.]|nr:DMT family transporter [Usitatibacter sp.]
MSKRGWALFVALGIIWGMPYLLIRIAVGTIDPLVVAFGRTLVGALLLLPVALHRKVLAAAFRHWPALVAFTLVEISLPWLLIGHAETRLNSSTAGLLVAMVPLMAAAIVAWLGHEKLRPRRVLGLFVGFLGVAALVGLDVRFSDWLAVLALVLASLGYAVGPIIVSRKLRDAPTLGVITGSLMLATALYAPFALFLWPAHATAAAFASVVGLGVICTATAFLIFFALIAEAGPARATVIAYVNPLVAIVLGVIFLGEPLTLGMAVGFPMVIVGSILAARV